MVPIASQLAPAFLSAVAFRLVAAPPRFSAIAAPRSAAGFRLMLVDAAPGRPDFLPRHD
ncbi:MAG: hypothetical protein ACRD04_02690 [Terriglobales bacterium]